MAKAMLWRKDAIEHRSNSYQINASVELRYGTMIAVFLGAKTGNVYPSPSRSDLHDVAFRFCQPPGPNLNTRAIGAVK